MMKAIARIRIIDEAVLVLVMGELDDAVALIVDDFLQFLNSGSGLVETLSGASEVFSFLFELGSELFDEERRIHLGGFEQFPVGHIGYGFGVWKISKLGSRTKNCNRLQINVSNSSKMWCPSS